jgi:hypothetical protein
MVKANTRVNHARADTRDIHRTLSLNVDETNDVQQKVRSGTAKGECSAAGPRIPSQLTKINQSAP